MKRITFIVFALCSIITKSQDTLEINDLYSFKIWGALEYSFDEQTTTTNIKTCHDWSLSFYIYPDPINSGEYRLYDLTGNLIRKAYGDSWFRYIPIGEYVIMDGSDTVCNVNKEFIDRSSVYEIILVTEDLKEITDFSADYLNSIEYTAALKNNDLNSIDSCAPYHNWSVNQSISDYGNDLKSFDVQPGDSITVGIDGVENCTEGCYSYKDAVFHVTNKPTGRKQALNLNIKIFPTDFNEKVTISSSHEKMRLIELYSINGQLIKTEKTNGLIHTINTTDINKGIYNLKVTLNNNSVLSQKVIK
jgi:hypothetical protein